MLTKLQKWGNSQGVRLNKHILHEIGIALGDEVEVTTESGRIIIEPQKRRQQKYTIENLVREMPAEYNATEVDWGKPQGREVW